MPSHQKTCNICRQPFAAGETRQPHPNANGVGYGVAHKRCAARFTRKGQAKAVAAPVVTWSKPDAPEEYPKGPSLGQALTEATDTMVAQVQNNEPAPEEKPKRRSRHK